MLQRDCSFLLASDVTERYLDVTLANYEMAFDMMRELKTDDQKQRKESILLLRNYGKCHSKTVTLKKEKNCC